MPQAVSTVIIPLHGMSAGILRGVSQSPTDRLDDLETRLDKLRTLAGVLLNRRDVNAEVGDLIGVLHDGIDACMLLCNGPAAEYFADRPFEREMLA
ncbi:MULTISPECIES: hypothetical protein [Sphingomonadales]|jgi:hypothetical protein|uniref:hypothetical protein n=1 Tax=Sphingomonadales TaxID=204457 RepID=UPI000825BB91|nr:MULTISPECIES: hypothetical protein [Sphingomonadales]